MLSENCWLPTQELYENYDSWKEYEDMLYSIFKHDFLDDYPCFENVRVNVKHYPIEYGKEEAFFTPPAKITPVMANVFPILGDVKEFVGYEHLLKIIIAILLFVQIVMA